MKDYFSTALVTYRLQPTVKPKYVSCAGLCWLVVAVETLHPALGITNRQDRPRVIEYNYTHVVMYK
jgi:hypothetical protein